MNKRWKLCILLLVACALLSSCMFMQTEEAVQQETSAERVPVSKVETLDINSVPIKDDSSLYTEYDRVEPVCFYITVKGGSVADGTNHTLQEVDSYHNEQGLIGVEKIKTEIIFQVGDETGPMPGEVGYDAITTNATMNVRGRTSTTYTQKSYRIDLFDTAGLWRGQRAIALNKHPGDPTRLRNMLYFELLESVPDITSLRTQFVHLYVKDETAQEPASGFVDYGLFTQVELPNGRYLRNHGLSRDGALYKANMCEMFRYEDAIKLATDPTFDQVAFDAVLEPKTTNDHTKLIEMLEAVGDPTIPIEDVIEKHFDLNNLTSYLAFNMLMANPDSNAQNYLLYSPVNSDTWYYICWDGDGALAYYEDALLDNQWTEPEWTKGISDYWAVKLFNRMLRVPAYRQALLEKVEQLRADVVNAQNIDRLIKKYRQTVDKFTTTMPDAINMRIATAQLEKVYNNMPYDTDIAYQNILDSLEKPMPFYLSDVVKSANGLRLLWDAAYDFDGEFVRYDVQVATDWNFAEGTVVFESMQQLDVSAVVPMLAPGRYYWRVVARNESGQTQIAFDEVSTGSGLHGGMRRFVVNADGTVANEV